MCFCLFVFLRYVPSRRQLPKTRSNAVERKDPTICDTQKPPCCQRLAIYRTSPDLVYLVIEEGEKENKGKRERPICTLKAQSHELSTVSLTPRQREDWVSPKTSALSMQSLQSIAL